MLLCCLHWYESLLFCSDNNLPFRDTNGFRKLIVLLTASGKVFGLHSGDGRILWTSTAPAAAAASSSSTKQHLRVWRRFHDLTHAPQLAVISTGGEGGSCSLLVLNGHTGEVLQEQQLPYAATKVSAWAVLCTCVLCYTLNATDCRHCRL
jgi:hypothetical protein